MSVMTLLTGVWGWAQRQRVKEPLKSVYYGTFVCRYLWQHLAVSSLSQPRPRCPRISAPALGREDCSSELARFIGCQKRKRRRQTHKAVPLITGGWGAGSERVSGSTPTWQNSLWSSVGQAMLCEGGFIIFTVISVST